MAVKILETVGRFLSARRLMLCLFLSCRKCQEAGCAKQPTFGGRDDMVVRFCAVHRRPGDVDLVHARCRKNDCLKVALFGFQGGSPQLCYQHREDRMVNMNVLLRPVVRALLRSGAGQGSHCNSRAKVDAWSISVTEPLITPLRGWAGVTPHRSEPASSMMSPQNRDGVFHGGREASTVTTNLVTVDASEASHIHQQGTHLGTSQEHTPPLLVQQASRPVCNMLDVANRAIATS